MPTSGITKREFLKASAAGLFGSAVSRAQSGAPLNVVLILADDLGYGDLSCYGSRMSTPNLDRMAADGARLTNFYSASPVCSPSRAALLTGRYPTRVGVPGVLPATSKSGLAESETTVADAMRAAGRRTKCVGKWHVGTQPQYLPTRRGFDEYFGLPYSNDMWPLPLMDNDQTIEENCKLDTLQQRYTQKAVNFITRSKDTPFFLYLAPDMPHIPLAASERFKGKSAFGAYGDAIAEMDWSVGEVLRALAENGLDDRTLVMFTSDNGPWYQGSPGRLRGRKGQTLEGGMREPFIARLPGRIPGGLVSDGVATMMDLLPTMAGLANAPLPQQTLDGVDIWPLLSGGASAVSRDIFLYFDVWHAQCARMGPWKLHVSRYNTAAWNPDPAGGRVNLPLPRPELYNLDNDPEESYDVAAAYPGVVAEIRARMEAMLPGFPDQVGDAWRGTMSIPVLDTPAGSLPVAKTA